MTTTQTRRRTTSPAPTVGRWPLTAVAAGLVAVAIAAMAVGLVVAGGSYTEPLPGLPDPGPLVGWGAPALRLLTDLAAVLTIGWLLAATVLDPSGKDGVVSPVGRRDLRRAGLAALAWGVLALLQLFFELANALALTLSEVADPKIVSTYATELASTRALLVMAILAAVVAGGVLFTATTGAAAAWLVVAAVAASLPALAGHASGLGDHALAMTAGVAHVVAAVFWVGGLVALAVHAARREASLARATQRFSTIALVAIVLLAASGAANAYTRLDNPGQLFTTGYGQVTIAKVTLILGLGVIGWIMRSRVLPTLNRSSRIGAFARVASIELLIMAAAIGLGVALASSPPPRIEVPLDSYGESLLGYAYPPPPSIATVGGGFYLEPLFLTASLVAAGLYLAGATRLHRRGDHWPILRTLSWLFGIVIVVWTTNAGISLYSQVSAGMHMVQHMTMTMLAPIFLVMGAPATLALRALNPAKGNERGPREWLVWLLHSWITRLLTNPIYVFFVYVIGLYGLYFTPLFGWLMGNHAGHVLMQMHFIISGYLFYWVLIGIDPRPKPLPYWGRLVLLLLASSLHGFFAVALMMDTTPIAPEWYSVVQPPWITDPIRDTIEAGQFAWGLAEVPSLIVLIVIAVQWARSDDREATRKDRQADRDDDAELRAYNARLAALAERDDRPGRRS